MEVPEAYSQDSAAAAKEGRLRQQLSSNASSGPWIPPLLTAGWSELRVVSHGDTLTVIDFHVSRFLLDNTRQQL